MKVEIKENVFRKFMDESGYSMLEFSKLSGLSVSTIHYVFHEHKAPRRRTIMRLCKASKGKLTPKDFGLN